MGYNANKKNMGSKKNLKNWQTGCKLLEIMADGMYAVFHRFEAFLKKVDAQAVTVGWPSNGRRASSISAPPPPNAQKSAGRTACSLLPAAGCAAA